ncbi:MAG: sec-independent protein translocase protein TatA [Frankiales bacterium]|jgi:sec-independent protein translocase protein TatA|nr:sec-independent protein translocase protein TatA [Frankiales bacterium]MDX6221176.1 sec-independent protein translocase protein TatA [Frankiales bacterium]
MGDGIFSGAHLLIVAVIFVLLFGASKLPIFARSLGQSMRIFKSEIKGLKDDDETAPTPPAMVQQQPVIQAPAPIPPVVQAAPAPQIFTDANGQQFVMQPVTPQSEQH